MPVKSECNADGCGFDVCQGFESGGIRVIHDGVKRDLVNLFSRLSLLSKAEHGSLFALSLLSHPGRRISSVQQETGAEAFIGIGTAMSAYTN